MRKVGSGLLGNVNYLASSGTGQILSGVTGMITGGSFSVHTVLIVNILNLTFT